MYDLIDVKTQKKDRASIVKLYLKINTKEKSEILR